MQIAPAQISKHLVPRLPPATINKHLTSLQTLVCEQLHVNREEQQVMGVSWFYYTGLARRPPSARARRHMDGTFPTLFLLFQEGKIPPLVQEIYPLEQYREALDGIAGRGAMGKIVLVP